MNHKLIAALAVSLGHTLEPPVPSLFTFRIDTPWLRALPGVAVSDAEVSVLGTKLKERGPLLVTHWGVIRALTGQELTNAACIRLT